LTGASAYVPRIPLDKPVTTCNYYIESSNLLAVTLIDAKPNSRHFYTNIKALNSNEKLHVIWVTKLLHSYTILGV